MYFSGECTGCVDEELFCPDTNTFTEESPPSITTMSTTPQSPASSPYITDTFTEESPASSITTMSTYTEESEVSSISTALSTPESSIRYDMDMRTEVDELDDNVAQWPASSSITTMSTFTEESMVSSMSTALSTPESPIRYDMDMRTEVDELDDNVVYNIHVNSVSFDDEKEPSKGKTSDIIYCIALIPVTLLKIALIYFCKKYFLPKYCRRNNEQNENAGDEYVELV